MSYRPAPAPNATLALLASLLRQFPQATPADLCAWTGLSPSTLTLLRRGDLLRSVA